MADGERVAWAGSLWPVPRCDAALNLEDLTGPFALVAARGDTLVLARGRLGGHPLFYATDRDLWLACSRLEPLVRVLGRSGSFDTRGLAELVLDFPGDISTAYRGISRLRAGEVLSIGPQGWESRRRPLVRSTYLSKASPDDVAEELRHRIGAAVDRAVGSSRRVAVSVGGLDSSGILATSVARARGASRQEVLAVTLHFAGLDDDRPYVQDLCQALGITPARIDPASSARFLLSPIAVDAAPITLPQASWAFETTRWAREQGVDVILQGEGGDQLFFGDLEIFADDFLQGHPVRALREVSRLRGIPWFPSRFQRISGMVLEPAARRRLPRLERLVRRARRLRRRTPSSLPWAGTALRPTLDALGSIHRGAEDMALGGEVLNVREFSERCGAWGGCRWAEPYLDEDLVAFVMSLPKHLLFHGGYGRGLFRHAFRGLLPESIRLRETKSGFAPALEATFRAAGARRLVEPHAGAGVLADLGLVRPKEFRSAVEQFLQDPQNPAHWFDVWPVIVLEAFVSRSAEERPSPVALAV
jgi:asparagine synthase (glutamine-hydrolysing)